jgi:hypothetical protein
MTYQRTTVFVVSFLYFSFANQYSLGGGFPFPIVLVPRYKLSLCHTPIKPDLLGFRGIGVFACGLRDHEVRIKYGWLDLGFQLLFFFGKGKARFSFGVCVRQSPSYFFWYFSISFFFFVMGSLKFLPFLM